MQTKAACLTLLKVQDTSQQASFQNPGGMLPSPRESRDIPPPSPGASGFTSQPPAEVAPPSQPHFSASQVWAPQPKNRGYPGADLDTVRIEDPQGSREKQGF